MIKEYISDLSNFPFDYEFPWEITTRLEDYILRLISDLSDEYEIKEGVAIHNSVHLGHNVIIKAPAIICENCFIGANSYLRNGVFMAPGAKIGISCEIKTSVLMENSAIAHFNFIGDSIKGKM